MDRGSHWRFRHQQTVVGVGVVLVVLGGGVLEVLLGVSHIRK
jgi:hypothetical protein